jgi:4-alpha-glucanotransferase
LAFDLSERASGILLHPTSLPGPYGNGDLGGTRAFADLLRRAGQRCWQMLPVGPVGYGDSPYSAQSAFAGSPLLIGLEELAREGLLARGDLAGAPQFPEERVDYSAAAAFRSRLLRKAFAGLRDRRALDAFAEEHRSWLDDFALFRAIKLARHETSWVEWEPELRSRSDLSGARRALADEVAFHRFEQWIFEKQWQAFKEHCDSIGLKLIGDIPIFVAHGSLPLIAEDLGLVTPEVTALRKALGLPGLKILQFAFGTDPQAPSFKPHNYERECVAYTGTHDNDTTVGWFFDTGERGGTRSPEQCETERRNALAYLGTSGREIHWEMIRELFKSVANLAVVPVQDVLGLGSEARMNRPGTASGNWAWRMRPGAFDAAVLERLPELSRIYDRWSGSK